MSTQTPSSNESGPFTGTCHCGRISLTIPSKPAGKVNECRCTVCYKLGCEWGYFARGVVTITEKDGARRIPYTRTLEDLSSHKTGAKKPSIAFSHCSVCGTVTDWTGLAGTRREGDDQKMGVNMRIFGVIGEAENAAAEGVEREVSC